MFLINFLWVGFMAMYRDLMRIILTQALVDVEDKREWGKNANVFYQKWFSSHLRNYFFMIQ